MHCFESCKAPTLCEVGNIQHTAAILWATAAVKRGAVMLIQQTCFEKGTPQKEWSEEGVCVLRAHFDHLYIIKSSSQIETAPTCGASCT